MTKLSPMKLDDRIREYAERGASGCWNWPGKPCDKGYGRACQYVRGGSARQIYVHRRAYELLVGSIPDGTVIDHICRNRRCFNPAHLQPVTHRVNIHRGTGVGARNAVKTHCPNGHPYLDTAIHTRTYKSKAVRYVERQCPTCRREQGKRRQAEYMARKKERAAH